MSPTYKLTYFDVKGLGEPCRLVFAYANVSYEDIRIERGVEWPKIKKNYPWETLPVLEVDGKMLGESQVILRYLGKKFNIAGENEFESSKCDEMVETMSDLITACKKYFVENNEEKKNEILIEIKAEIFPKYFGKWNEILTKKNNGFLVGKQLSYADICIASYLELYNDNFGGNILDKYSGLQSHQDTVFNAPGIKEWVAKRPKSQW